MEDKKLGGKGDISNCPKCGGNLSYTEWMAGVGDASCDIDCDDCEFGGYVTKKSTRHFTRIEIRNVFAEVGIVIGLLLAGGIIEAYMIGNPLF